jgi:hypothetical protein
MVDMLCCALGCVILVWLLNAKQSEDDAEERSAEIDTVMARAKAEREEGQKLLADARGEQERTSARLRTLARERDRWVAQAARLEERISGLESARAKLAKELGDERGRAKALAGELVRSGERVKALEAVVRTGTARLDDERKRVSGLSKQVGEKEETLKGARAELARRESALKALQADLNSLKERNKAERMRADGLAKKIELSEREMARTDGLLRGARLAKEKADAALAARDRDLNAAGKREKGFEKLLRDRQAALDAVNARLAKLEKESKSALAEAGGRVARAEKERESALAALNVKVARLEKEKLALAGAAEARFAGIELTGRRVVFLVDSSGSMEMLDDKTDAPQKWVEVRRTVARLMRSLPGLEKYQLITFAAATSYPLGSAGRWLEHDAKTSPELALRALAAVKPRGGTNMYLALEEAFAFRKAGLDTVFLLSDGLPTQGEGLTPAQARSLRGIERGVALGLHVRRKLKSDWNAAGPGRPRVKVHTVGFFYESPDLGSFLWALSRENDGSFVGMSRP